MKQLSLYNPFFNRRRAIPFALVVSLVGIVAIAVSQAASPLVAFESEAGILKGGAAVIDAAGASGGKAVQFNAVATPPPTPAPAGKPTLSNTGAFSGLRTDLPALATASSPSISSGTPTNPTIIRDKKFTNANFTFVGHDVQFINCVFEGSTSDQLIEIRDSTPANQSIKFIDSTIGAATPVGTHPLGNIAGIQLIRTRVYNGDHTIHNITSAGNVLVDSSILDARDTADSSSIPHGNTIYTVDGPAPNVVVRNSVLYGGTSQIIFDKVDGEGNGVAIDGWVFDGVWFYGNDRHKTNVPNPNWATENAFYSTATSTSEAFKNLHVRNSRFQRTGTGLNNLTRQNVAGGLTFAEWVGNTWDDNGATIPAPN